MTFTVQWYDTARKDLRSLDKQTAQRIIKKVKAVVENPLRFVDRLEGFPLYKLRVGNYRVILHLDISQQQILIILVGHRSNVYKELPKRQSV
ncbi:type II toxin-antitoxin system RelE/ParE family toxin [Candidatus Woesearchaeota archaeon]|nr:type II toxin-antitoxin system RelE/ParE family toxin [Candidatus Woesearchaeota archaeon]